MLIVQNKNGSISFEIIYEGLRYNGGMITLSYQQIKILLLLDEEVIPRLALAGLVFKKPDALTASERASLSRSVKRLVSNWLVIDDFIGEKGDYGTHIKNLQDMRYLQLTDRGMRACEILKEHPKILARMKREQGR